MEYEPIDWFKCHISNADTSILCPLCGKPSNIYVLKKRIIELDVDNRKVLYICIDCERNDENGEEEEKA